MLAGQTISGELRTVRYTAASSPCTTTIGRLRSLAHVRCLRALLTFGDFELHLIAFLQALVSLGSDCAVVNKYVWPIRTSDEPVPLGVIEPLNGSFQAFHVPPAFCTSLRGAPGRAPQFLGCILKRPGWAVKRLQHSRTATFWQPALPAPCASCGRATTRKRSFWHRGWCR